MIHLYTSRQYGEQLKSDNNFLGYRVREANEFRLLCTREWIVEEEFVKKGPYSRSRPKSVTSVRKHVTCPKCLELLLPQAQGEVDQMLAAYEKESGSPYVRKS